jgi:soluble lytic murein transglycosylase-like protein
MMLNDMAALEFRVAQLSGEREAPPQQSSRSVAAFAAMLGSLAAPFAAAPSASAPLPPGGLERLIANACASTGTDPALVKAIVANESGFDPLATSPAGAQGLMQLMPATAAEVGVRDAYDPAQNIAGGTRYLARLLQRFKGDVPTAVAAYNAGPEAVARGDVPAETLGYVRSVLDSCDRYRAGQGR